jgi:hypothetical protein
MNPTAGSPRVRHFLDTFTVTDPEILRRKQLAEEGAKQLRERGKARPPIGKPDDDD